MGKTIEETLDEEYAEWLNPSQSGLTDVDRAHLITEYAGIDLDASTTDYMCEHFNAIRKECATELETALRACIARAGNPDATEGCRQVIRTAQDALEGKEGG